MWRRTPSFNSRGKWGPPPSRLFCYVRQRRSEAVLTRSPVFNCGKFSTKHLRSHAIKNVASFKRSPLRVLTPLHPHHLGLLYLSADETLTVYTSHWLPARWHPSLPPVILIPPKHVTYRLCAPRESAATNPTTVRKAEDGSGSKVAVKRGVVEMRVGKHISNNFKYTSLGKQWFFFPLHSFCFKENVS